MRFSALQRAEIAEILRNDARAVAELMLSFSALQRAEIAEIEFLGVVDVARAGFSALQRAEIAEIVWTALRTLDRADGFSALQRAEIAEIQRRRGSEASPS